MRFVFDDLNTAFAKVHKAISHCKPIKPDHIPLIQASTEDYMTLYRKQFPNKVIPKQHILEHHCVPFIQKTKIGLGLLGEQGTELCHQTIKRIEKKAKGINNETDHMYYVMKKQMIQMSPVLVSAMPQAKSRKRKLFD